jgi:hypothetical protein
VAFIHDAIKAKARVDSKIKAKAILQLILPTPLGVGLRDAIQNSAVDFHGFKEIWVSPFREDSFPLKQA